MSYDKSVFIHCIIPTTAAATAIILPKHRRTIFQFFFKIQYYRTIFTQFTFLRLVSAWFSQSQQQNVKLVVTNVVTEGIFFVKTLKKGYFSSTLTAEFFNINQHLDRNEKCFIYQLRCKIYSKQYAIKTAGNFRLCWNNYKESNRTLLKTEDSKQKFLHQQRTILDYKRTALG